MSDVELIKTALQRAERTVTLRPERGQRVYTNVAKLGTGTSCRIAEAGHEILLDVGRALGGNNAGPSPSMALRSAMSGCVAIGIKQWAAQRDMQIDGLEVVLETDVDARGQLGVDEEIVPGFEAIRMTITVQSPAPRQRVLEAIETALKFSPLMDVFLNPQSVRHRVVFAETPGEAGGET